MKTSSYLPLLLTALMLWVLPVSAEKKDVDSKAAPAEARAEKAEPKAEKAKPVDKEKKSEAKSEDSKSKEEDSDKDDEKEEEEKEDDDPLSKEIAALKKEKELLELQNSLAEARLKQELAERRATIEREKLDLEEKEHELNKKTASLKEMRDDDLAELRTELERASLAAQISKAEMDRRVSELRLKDEEFRSVVSELRHEIEEKEKTKERNQYADREPIYLKDPLQDGALIISDRRIAMNDVISMRTATHVSERINYFNNKNTEYPIFIIIDDSPGGSVMAGYRILKAMESSEAPVYVVVKSFAASMAAVITTLAEESYAYPNAVMLHHQLSSFFVGNVTQQREEMDETEDWWHRLATPVAEKMGVSLQEFVDEMYAAETTGDWDEFADEARELKWVDHVVDEIQETSLTMNPDAQRPTPPTAPRIVTAEGERTIDPTALKFTEDETGRPVCYLPRLNAYDRWWLYNPDGFYRPR